MFGIAGKTMMREDFSLDGSCGPDVASTNASIVPLKGGSNVVDIVQNRLQQKGYPELARLRCAFCCGTLALKGAVPTYYLKQLALTTVMGMPGIDCIVDEIEVRLGARLNGQAESAGWSAPSTSQ
jgi:hypothetical protein